MKHLALLLCSALVACGSARPFGSDGKTGIPNDAKSLFAECEHYVQNEGPGYIHSQWKYCGDKAIPDAYYYRHYTGAAPGIEDVMNALAATNPAPGEPTIVLHDESRQVAGEAVEWLHVTLHTDDGMAWETLFGARTHDEKYFVCAVSRHDGGSGEQGPRAAAQAACPEAIDAMIRGVR